MESSGVLAPVITPPNKRRRYRGRIKNRNAVERPLPTEALASPFGGSRPQIRFARPAVQAPRVRTGIHQTTNFEQLLSERITWPPASFLNGFLPSSLWIIFTLVLGFSTQGGSDSSSCSRGEERTLSLLWWESTSITGHPFFSLCAFFPWNLWYGHQTPSGFTC